MADRKQRGKKNIVDEIGEELDTPEQKTVRKEAKGKEYESIYKMSGESRIPVSKHEGTVWEGRLKCAMKVTEKSRETWQEAIKYYNNDQMNHRIASNGDHSGNVVGLQRLTSTNTETENIVFSNVSTLTAVVYAKNPEATVTTKSEGNKELAKVLEEALNALIEKDVAPGFALKSKAERLVALGELTNNGWLKLTFTRKEDSSAEAMAEYEGVVAQLSKAKSAKEVEKLEQKLKALEEKVAFSGPGGIGFGVRSPFNVYRDPTATEEDVIDDDYMFEIDYMSTEYLNCVYGQKDEDGSVKSIYKPSHTMKMSSKDGNDVTALINNFDIIGEKDMDWQALGFSSMEAYARACYTEVVWVWDRIKKRVLLYASNDWTWPIWVWDDPLKLDRFFPYFRLGFYQNPLGGTTKGEVSYYLDQQDAINEINDEGRRMRHWVRRNIFYDKNKVKAEDVESFLKGPDETARGIDLPEGMTMKDLIFSLPVPSAQFHDIFQQQKQDKLEAINRISSMNDVLSGVQFKTNTTNDAVQSYQNASSIRTDKRVDALEDCLGKALWSAAQLLLMNYSAEDIGDLLDRDVASVWRQITDPRELRSFATRIVGGSSTKPTGKARKEEAVKVSQALGQFAKGAPMAAVIALEVLEDAFDNIVMSDEKWDQLIQSITTQQTNAVGGTPNGAPAAGGDGGQAGGAGGQLPPEIQQAVDLAVEQGVDPEVALQKVLERINGNA